MGITLCVICCFSFAAFNSCSLCLIFVNLINMCLGVFCLGFVLFGTLWVFWTWVAISFPILGKFSAIIYSSNFSWPFFLSSSSGTPMIRMLVHFTLSQRSLRLRLNNTLLNNQQIIGEIKKEIKICIEMSENEDTIQNLWDTVKAVLREGS